MQDFLQETLKLLINTQPQLPSTGKTGFPPPFPDINACKVRIFHLKSKSVCKQEAAEVGGCESGKLEDSSEHATVMQESDLALLAELIQLQ